MKSSVSSDIQTERSGLKNKTQASFLTHFKVFRFLIKHSFKRLIELLELIVKCGEDKGIKSPKAMQTKTDFFVLLS